MYFAFQHIAKCTAKSTTRNTEKYF